VLFTEPSLGSSFDVRENISGISIEKAPYQSSPLTQLKSGIAANNVICKAGLQLIIKAEDGSPACVKYTTANVLIERGWAREAIPTMTSLETTVIIPVNSSLLYNGFTFMPSIVKTVIGINNTVRWINMDSVNNDITSDTGAFKSAFIVSGYAWTHTFDKAGTYGYHSVIHPWLKGTVIVVGNNTLPASFMPCDTTFPPNNVGFPINEKNIPVLYMPTNSIGKICVTYSNPNNTTQTLSTAITIHDPNNSYQQVQDISAWTVYGFPTVSGKGNSTFVYEIKTGNQTGFYGLSFYCMGIPFAVGYNNDSTIVSNDFPWIGKDYSCPVLTYDFHIDSLTGIGLRHIPYP
ncbi:MAG: cupredoxin domain-containing protein, partial [Nitrosopumilaceae archaeon]